MIDDDSIRSVLEQRAAAAGDGPDGYQLSDRARLVAVPRSRAPARWRRLRLATVGGVAGAAVFAVILVSVGLSSRRAEIGPTTSQAIATARAGTDAELKPWTALTWHPVVDGGFEMPGRNVFILSVVEWKGNWIAAGYAFDLTSRSVGGIVVRSEDGRDWVRDPELPGAQFDRLVVSDDQVVIVGSHRQPDIGDRAGPTTPTLWLSSDGRTWRESPLPDGVDTRWALSDVAVGGRGWLLRLFDPDGDVRWLIGDPVSGWNDVTPESEAFADGAVASIVGTEDGWMAIGMTGADSRSNNGFPFGDPENDTGAIWWSDDGVHWRPTQIESPGTSVTSAHKVADGWIATGGDHGGCPRCIGGRSLMWRSVDGQAWTTVDLGSSQRSFLGWGPFASDGQRGLLFDHDDALRLRVRETFDGIEWSDIAVFTQPQAVLPQLSGILAIGSDAVVTFGQTSSESPAHAWMIPHLATAGEPPAGASTQSPAPPNEGRDVVCQEPAGEPCGP